VDWQDVAGETPEPDCDLLIELVQTLSDDAIMVELGTCQGRSGLAMASICRGQQVVYMVDNFRGEDHLGRGGWVWPDRDVLEENIIKMRAGERCVVVEGDTVQVGLDWDKGVVSLLFVDASHDYESVLADLRAWLPHVRGYVCLHDYADYAPGVIRAASEVFGRAPDRIHYLTGVYRYA